MIKGFVSCQQFDSVCVGVHSQTVNYWRCMRWLQVLHHI